ncbi:MAG TPA: DUF1998 domain-containing protein [Actinobacteria bacterium]|nr:DUF1998 domain-containing protein [Actinomycetota bacterium]
MYLHGGVEYLVERLDLTRREILVAEASVPWHTRAASETTLEVVSEADGRAIGDLTVHHGIVEVGTRVTGYRRIDDRTREVLEVVELDLPERRFTTQAVWYVFPDRVAAEVEPDRRAGAIHAAEHTAIGVLPRFAVCDRWDVGGLSTPWHPAVGAMVFFVYDGVPGGTGIAPIAFAEAERHLAATASILAGCGCRDGCPSCVQSPKCGNFNEPLDRFAALTLVEHWAGR